MGEALLKGMLINKLFNRSNITISDISSKTRKRLKNIYKVNVSGSNARAVKDSEIVLIAVKPQDVGGMLRELFPLLKNKLVISIAAGIKISSIKERSGSNTIIRVMPNTPAVVSSGISAISQTPKTKVSDLKVAEKIFGCVGEVVLMKEKYMDAITAISGSGPAYFFLLMEAMIDSAVSLGIKRDLAETLVAQTALGAAILQRNTGIRPDLLRKKVTSKGGTTEAATKIFQAKGFNKIVAKAMQAACKRAGELSIQ